MKNKNTGLVDKRGMQECTVRILLVIFLISFYSITHGQTNFKTRNGLPCLPLRTSPPEGVTDGAMYINSTDNHIYLYHDGKWNKFGGDFVVPRNTFITPLQDSYALSDVLTCTYDLGSSDPDDALGCTIQTPAIQWYRTDGSHTIAVEGATGSTYTLSAADFGQTISAKVTPTTDCGAFFSIPVFSNTVYLSVSPSFDGVLVDHLLSDGSSYYALTGEQLSARGDGYQCSPVTLAGDDGSNSAYQWYYSLTDDVNTRIALPGKISANLPIDMDNAPYSAGNYLWVGLTPVALNGEQGAEVFYSSPIQIQTKLQPSYESVSIVSDFLEDNDGQRYAPYNSVFEAELGAYLCSPFQIAGDAGGKTTFQWYYEASGGAKTIAPGTSNQLTYTIDPASSPVLLDHDIWLEVTPVADNDDAGSVLSTPRVHIYDQLVPSYVSVSLSGTKTDESVTYALNGYPLGATPTDYSCSPFQIKGDAGAATYQWYWSTGSNPSTSTRNFINGATSSSYTPDVATNTYANDNYIAVGVTPVAANGQTGTEIISSWYPLATLMASYAGVTLPEYTKQGYSPAVTLGAFTLSPAISDISEATPLYQWYTRTSSSDDWGEITGQTAAVFEVTNSYPDGTEFAVEVTPRATNGLVDEPQMSTTCVVHANFPPVASNVHLVGTLEATCGVSAAYTYSDDEDDPEGSSTFQWYRADDASGAGAQPIADATGRTYLLADADLGKYIACAVTPVASTGDSPGYPYFSSFRGPVTTFSCGISEVTFIYDGHQVTYGTLVAIDGSCWLDRDLGAKRVATDFTDDEAYGDLFQFGRPADGHQLIDWSTRTGVTGTTTTVAPDTLNTGTDKFVLGYNWCSLPDDQMYKLWSSHDGGGTNPCPPGWRVPAYAGAILSASPTATAEAAHALLHPAAAGTRVKGYMAPGDGTVYDLTDVAWSFWIAKGRPTYLDMPEYISVQAGASGYSISRSSPGRGASIRCTHISSSF